ncbi:ATP-dependent helicase/nuclease subunit A [Sporomusa rhizae]
MQCTPEQKAAIETRSHNLLVAAAAGSGKTWVLVERIIGRIIDPNERLSVDRLLVVTFTNAAANGMRSRIGEALNTALNSPELTDPELRRHVERQLVLLNAANISTLHAFCQSLVRQYFYLLEIEPSFRIANDTEITLIKSDVLEAVFEEGYFTAEPCFLELIEHYGDENGDNSLAGLVLKLYDFSRSHPWPDYWLDSLTEAFELPPDADFDDTPWSALVRDKFMLDWEEARQALIALLAETVKPGNPAAYGQTFAEDIQLIDKLIVAAKQSWAVLTVAMQETAFPRIASVGKEITKEVKDYFQAQRNKAKKRVLDAKAVYFERSGTELMADLRQAQPLVAGLVKLIKAFAIGFLQAKQSKGVVDFNDLEHLCLAVLRDKGASPEAAVPSAVALSLKDRFSEIMVDEYQDTNRVQEEIIRLIANEKQPNLFMVGDVKQSIYRFRLAEPALFMDKYRNYQDGAMPGCKRIDLSQNFRSREGVLHAANFLFGQLMTQRTAELDYGEAEQLNPGPAYQATELKCLDGPVELLIIDRDKAETDEETGDMDGQQAEQGAEEADGQPVDNVLPEEELSAFEQEAILIARRIQELLTGGYHAFDKQVGGYRPLQYRDIVILLRSVKGKAQVLQDRLRQNGVPCYAELDSGYFAETEVTIMLALLQIIDNPRQDIPLAAVLRSPFLRLTGDQMAELRLCEERGSLWEAMQAYCQTEGAPAHVKLFLEKFTVWRGLARRKGVAELIWRIYQDTGYYDYVGGMPGGVLRQANLRALYDRARQYETTAFRGLFRFLRFVERLKDKESDLSVARALGESEDVVRVMSIHKSKGLEFPVVITADIGKNFNMQDASGLMLCHKELGVGPYVTLPELRFRYPTPARWGIQHKLALETKAEELRILYVALTRAREKLILVGSAKKLAQKCAVWQRTVGEPEEKLPASQVLKGKSYLDWVGMAVARHTDGELLRQYGECTQQPAAKLAQHPSAWKVAIYRADEIASLEQYGQADDALLDAVSRLEPVAGGAGTGWVGDILNWEYGCAAAVSKPAKLAVSEIKRRLELIETEEAEPLFALPVVHARPRFLQATSSLTPVEYGVMVHTVMQHIQLSGECTPAAIAEQAQALEARQILLPGQAKELGVQTISGFFASELGRRMLKARQVWREMPFSLMLPAEKFYPDLQGCGEQIFIQGVIDCLFAEADGLVLLDYKTDKASSAADLAAKYAAQLSMYTVAIERILKRPVKEQYLYAFALGQAIKLDAWG